jgi:hypothetical protein
MSVHIMVDLETWGIKPGSAIRSIGGRVFDPASNTVGEGFYANVSRASCEARGLKVDPETEAYWSRQSEAARAAPIPDQLDVYEVVNGFTSWWREQRGLMFWAHSPNFDESLLQAVYGACGLVAPWRYWNTRCTRTIYDLANVKPDRAVGTHHHALDDATVQARAVCASYQALLVKPASVLAAATAVHAVRPVNWDDEEDAEQAAAWRSLEAALAGAPA